MNGILPLTAFVSFIQAASLQNKRVPSGWSATFPYKVREELPATRAEVWETSSWPETPPRVLFQPFHDVQGIESRGNTPACVTFSR
jgi:hypothetical protein